MEKQDVHKILFRASEVGWIMTNGRGKETYGETAKSCAREKLISEKYGRENEVYSKYLEKGKRAEEDALTLLSIYKKHYFKKNDERLNNEWITGEPDAYVGESVKEAVHGYDVKSPYSVFTMPLATDKIKKEYEWQAHSYMWLTGALKWTISYCLVNTPSNLIQNERTNLWYKFDSPYEGHPRFGEYIHAVLNLEKQHIFDIEQFRKDYTNFDLEHDKVSHDEEFKWKHDIPVEKRIVEFEVERDKKKHEQIKKRVEEIRNYMESIFDLV